jgi:carotenoid cleavage dioxygenase-like enzyme
VSPHYRPAYLAGAFAPVSDEITAERLPVTGQLPRELSGRYLRNGPNPVVGEEPGHWFRGSGMVHGVRLRGGVAEWYRNRWVRTARFAEGPSARPGQRPDLRAVSANTHVIEHAGRIFALVENGLPHELTRRLDTVGPEDFGGRLTTAMTAHPKTDPITGELHFFGYAATRPHLTYHVLSAAGGLVHSRPVEVPGPTMMHDFAITANHIIWLDLPLTFSAGLLTEPTLPYRWDDDYGARIGVMPRLGGPVRWFDVDPCYVYHVGNAYEDPSGRIVLDAVRYDRTGWHRLNEFITGVAARPTVTAFSPIHRWILNPATGTVDEQAVGGHGVEFPSLNADRVGLPHRYLYSVSAPADGSASAIIKHDMTSGESTRHRLSADAVPGEVVFVPRERATDEDDGWLIGIVADPVGDAAELIVLDAGDVSRPPVASVRLPRRVPVGFHGSWIPDRP